MHLSKTKRLGKRGGSVRWVLSMYMLKRGLGNNKVISQRTQDAGSERL